jgi:DNA-binding PadR family transcriptional regulator
MIEYPLFYHGIVGVGMILTPDETILGLLAVQARHGYELLDCFHDSHQLGRVWKLSTSQVYNVLKRLERETLITGREVATDTGPSRVEYTLSAKGHQHLMKWLYEPSPSPSIRRVRVEFLSRLFIAQELNLPTSRIIHAQREVCLREREHLGAAREKAQMGMDVLAIDFVIEQLDAVSRWITRCESVSFGIVNASQYMTPET